MHSIRNAEENRLRDLNGENVLISNRFWYFGCCPIPLPDSFREIIPNGPGHRRIKDERIIKDLIQFLEKQEKSGQVNDPTEWPPELSRLENCG